jgi:3'(2'), 5'-bisphosphate nucleotidase
MSWLAVPPAKEPLGGVHGTLFVASRGHGVTRISLKDGTEGQLPTRSVTDQRLVVAASFAKFTVDLPKPLRKRKPPVQLLSLASQAKYAALATGHATLYPRKPSQSRGPFYAWDHAAGSLLVEESGGMVTDLAGDMLKWLDHERLLENRGLLAACDITSHREYQPLFADHARKLLTP